MGYDGLIFILLMAGWIIDGGIHFLRYQRDQRAARQRDIAQHSVTVAVD
ncbi:MAG: hypothetical protein JO316_25530 [Abitibacteriaceae bacterium]|nr:hypothetical protein [Abditibacteriaceae bacterium]